MQQLNLRGQTKTEEAIEFIREHEPSEGYFVGYSGGKDSEVTLDLVKKSGVKFKAYYSSTGIDPPEIVHHIKRHHPEVIFCRPEKSFYEYIELKGYPTKFARWCCDWIKERPTRNIGLNNRLMGIRAEESRKRANKGRIGKISKYTIYKPIFPWLEWEIWDYIERHNLPYCSLYDEGFSRIGCVVCPFLCRKNQGALLKHKNRWPKQYAAFERAMTNLFNNWLCVVNPRSGALNFRYETDVREFIENWYRGFMPK